MGEENREPAVSEIREADLEQPPQRSRRLLVYRHARITRLTHWINLLCVTALLMSGLQIFMAHPALYWGQFGAKRSRSGPMSRGMACRRLASPGSVQQHSRPRGSSAFPATQAATLYSAPFQGGLFQADAISLWGGGGISFLLGCSSRTSWLISWPELPGHLRRDLLPSKQQLRPRSLLKDALDHLRLTFPHGEKARHYNPLQLASISEISFS
jgi:Prokaryotic cytochrome b561